MDFSLHKNALDYYRTLGAKPAVNEFTAEAVVPDTQEDIARILCAQCTCSVHSKDVTGGRAAVSGEAEVTVMYAPESENGAAAIGLKIPFSLAADFEGAGEPYPAADVRVTALDVRLLNPRKVLAKCEVRARTECWAKDELVWYDGAEDQSGVFTRADTRTVRTAALAAEKTFVLTEELPMPPGKPVPEKLLSRGVSVRVDDTQDVGGRLIVRGTAAVGMFYLPADSVQPEYAEIETQFSQLMELPGEPMAAFDVSSMLTDAFLEIFTDSNGVRAVSLEVHAALQAVFYRDTEMKYICDAYSPAGEVTLQRTRTEVMSSCEAETVRAVQRCQPEMPRPAKEILAALCLPGEPAAAEGKLTAETSVNMVCRADDGALFSQSVAVQAEADWAGTADAVGVRAGSAIAVPAGNCADLRLPLDFFVRTRETGAVEYVSAMSLDDERLYTQRRPSVTVVRAETDDLWSIAKRYRSSERVIAGCNALQDGEAVAGKILLIPKY
jgi:hypothetical protein